MRDAFRINDLLHSLQCTTTRHEFSVVNLHHAASQKKFFGKARLPKFRASRSL
jgi:hypothetical protein